MRPDETMANAFVPGAAALSATDEALVERRRRLLGPAYRLMYASPLHIVRGEGVWLYDERGDAYLDAYNNVASVGHCHPRVVEAMAGQAARLATNTRYLDETILDCAEALLATFPEPLSQVMFTCTGSESNDLAIRLARAYTGGTGIVVTRTAYHGTSQATAEISPSLGRGVALGAHVRAVAPPDPWREGADEAARRFAADVDAAIDDLVRHGIRPAALIVDTRLSRDGVVPGPKGFLAGPCDAIRRAGGVFVADEVQPGFGRTGEAMWGFERHGTVPDMVSLGKPMGNGYPVAALVLQPRLVEEFGAGARYFNTFGGNTVAVATARAVLGVIADEGLQANALAVGEYLRRGLEDIAASHQAIGEVRSAGLFLGVEMVDERDSKAPDAALASDVVNGLRERRVLVSVTGAHANVLKIRPPLTFAREHADWLLERLASVMGESARSASTERRAARDLRPRPSEGPP